MHTDYTNPETGYVNEELGNAIETAINSLSNNYATIARKFFLEELSHEEISNDLSIPVGTVKGTISRAKEMLRKRLSNF